MQKRKHWLHLTGTSGPSLLSFLPCAEIDAEERQRLRDTELMKSTRKKKFVEHTFFNWPRSVVGQQYTDCGSLFHVLNCTRRSECIQTVNNWSIFTCCWNVELLLSSIFFNEIIRKIGIIKNVFLFSFLQKLKERRKKASTGICA